MLGNNMFRHFVGRHRSFEMFKTIYSKRLLLVNHRRDLMKLLCTINHKPNEEIDTANVNEKRVEQLATLYNVKRNDAIEMMKVNSKLTTTDLSRLEKLVQVVKSMQMGTNDILRYPKVATLSPGEMKHRYYCLMELGFKNISMDDILRYTDIIKLHLNSSIITWNPLDSMMKHMDGPENLKEIIENKYPVSSIKTLQWLHRAVVLEYLVWKLNLSLDEVLAIIDKYATLGNQSIIILNEVLDLLIKEFKFTIKKIQSNGFLLIILTENIHHLMVMKPKLGGVPIREFARKFPRVLSLDVNNVKEIDDIFQKFGITDEQIFSCGNVYSLNSATVRQRLAEVETIPEFIKLKSSHRYLELIYYLSKVKNRLQHIKELDLNEYSLDLLICSDKDFTTRLSSWKNHERREAITAYLAKKCNVTVTYVKRRLSSMPKHFTWYSVKFDQIDKTLEYLLNSFNRKEVLKYLPLVLFDVKLVKRNVEIVNSFDSEKVILECVKARLFAHLEFLKIEMEVGPNTDLKYGRRLPKANLTVENYLKLKKKEL